MNKIVHVLSRYEPKNTETQRRIAVAQKTWEDCFYKEGVVPVHVWPHEYRRSSKGLGDNRGTAFLKDMLIKGIDSVSNDKDLIILSNDDTILHPNTLPAILQRIEHDRKQCCCSFRYDVYGKVGSIHDILASQMRMKQSPGRDLFVFTREWLLDHMKDIPDYVLGATDWDYFLGILMRRYCGGDLSYMDAVIVDTTSDLPMGYVFHEQHQAWWSHPDNVKTAYVQKWNKKLTYNALVEMGYEGKLYGARQCDLA